MNAQNQTRLEFNSLGFSETEDELVIRFLNLFKCAIKKSDLKKIGKFTIEGHAITFEANESRVHQKFNFLLSNAFMNLDNTLTHKPTTYIHMHSGIPLLGTPYFGFIDRNTNVIEIRTITGCSIDCVYCSVDEHQRNRDFVVEKDYLIEELHKLVQLKDCKDIEAQINPQAEPFLYADMIPMIADMSKISEIKTISVNTNGTFLSKSVVDKLVEAGLTRINFSINTLNKERAQEMAGAAINHEKVLEMLDYASTKMDITVAPVLMMGVNDEDIPALLEHIKMLQSKTKFLIRVGIQNFLVYKYSKKPQKQMTWEEFYAYLKKLEHEHGINLSPDFGIHECKKLPVPFHKDEIIQAEVVCDGRFTNEKIAVAKDRAIMVKGCHKLGLAKIRITKAKDNMFTAIPV